MSENVINSVDVKGNAPAREKRKLNNIPVFKRSLAYKMIELGYFDDLVGMANHRTKPGEKVYYFTRTKELEQIIEDYDIDRKVIKDALIEMED